MRAYISIIRLRFILLLQYRAAAAAGICTQFFFGFVRVMAMEAFYLNGAAAQPLSYSQSVTYIWLSQALLGLQPWGGDAELGMMIRSGNVAYELCRPLSLYNHWFCRALALRSAPTLLRLVPVFLITSLLLPPAYSLKPPPSTGAALACLLAVFGALLISSAITCLLSIAMLWTISGEGLIRLLPALVSFLSGLVVPLPLFPEWLQPVLGILPFSGLLDIPMNFYNGHFPLSMLPGKLLFQLAWSLILAGIGQLLLSRATKRITVQGG